MKWRKAPHDQPLEISVDTVESIDFRVRERSSGSEPHSERFNRFLGYSSPSDFIRQELFSERAYRNTLERKNVILDPHEDLWQHFVVYGQFLDHEWTVFFSPSFARRHLASRGLSATGDIFDLWADSDYSISLSPYMDSAWYLLRNPDVLRSGMDPLVHWCLWGAAENRDPAPFVTTGAGVTRELLRRAQTDQDADQAWDMSSLNMSGLSAAFDPNDCLLQVLSGEIRFCTNPEILFGEMRSWVSLDPRILERLYIAESEK